MSYAGGLRFNKNDIESIYNADFLQNIFEIYNLTYVNINEDPIKNKHNKIVNLISPLITYIELEFTKNYLNNKQLTSKLLNLCIKLVLKLQQLPNKYKIIRKFRYLIEMWVLEEDAKPEGEIDQLIDIFMSEYFDQQLLFAKNVP